MAEKQLKKRRPVVFPCGADAGIKTTNRGITWTRGWKEKQREAKEGLDGQCQGRSEGEKHRRRQKQSLFPGLAMRPEE